MKKWVKDLTYDEIRELIENDSYLKDRVLNRTLDDAYYWVGEYLEGVPRTAVDFEYFGRGEHFTVEDATDEFMEWVDDVQRDYDWLDDETYSMCKRANELWRKIYYDEDVTDEDEIEYEKLLEDIGYNIFSQMKYEYDAAFDHEVWVEAFNSYVDEFIDDVDNSYVDTETWEIHNINDEESENLDYDLDEQLELPID